jgi:lipopolysaccharide export system protein LptA
MKRRHVVLLAMVPLSLAMQGATPAQADPVLGSPSDPVAMQADQLEVDVGTGSAVFTGNVSLAKGDLHVSCPRIEVKFDSSPHVSWARGSGGVTADLRGVHAEAPEVELDLTKQLLELRGGVKLTRGQGWLQAEKASIDIATVKVTLAQVKGSIPVPPKGH